MARYLNRDLSFPDPRTANRDGLLAVGGDLSVDRLLLAYRSGIFPWPVFDTPHITWFSPDPRAILELSDLHVSRSLMKVLKRGHFDVSIDRDFAGVIDGCAESRPHTWIIRELRNAYVDLHLAGHAHSVECWQDGELVGGLYGVAIAGLFAGESMFSRVSNASKVALIHLVERLQTRGYGLLDIQQSTPHLTRMGATEIRRSEYLRRLRYALTLPCRFI